MKEVGENGLYLLHEAICDVFLRESWSLIISHELELSDEDESRAIKFAYEGSKSLGVDLNIYELVIHVSSYIVYSRLIEEHPEHRREELIRTGESL